MTKHRVREQSGSFDPERIRQNMLDGANPLGKIIGPTLAELLKAERLGPLPPQTKECWDAFEPIYRLSKSKDVGKKLIEAGIDREAGLFLTSDTHGNLLRRFVVNTLFAQMIDDAVVAKTPAEQELKRDFVGYHRLASWSRFVTNYYKAELSDEVLRNFSARHPSENILNDRDFARNFLHGFRGKGKYAGARKEFFYELASTAYGVASRFKETHARLIGPDYTAAKERFLTDPGHAFSLGDLKFFFDVTNEVEASKIPPFVRPVAVLLAEDDPGDALWRMNLKDVKNFSSISPKVPQDANEEEGIITTADRAYDVMCEYMDAQKKVEPSPVPIVVADIELLPVAGGMKNGLELVRKLHERYPEAVIRIVYSSNPAAYQDEVEQLLRDGVIDGWHDKNKFGAKVFTESTNEILKSNRVPKK